jgi:hypothetical protein
MKRAQVITPWMGSGTDTATFRPQLAADYGLVSWVDVTGQPAASLVPSPNLYTVEIVCQDAILAQIAADANYSIVWSESA